MADKREKNKKRKEEYPGVRFDPNLKKWIATCQKKGIVYVATCHKFEQAKSAMIEFKKG